MADIVTSKNGKPIRLNDERWAHIIEEHGELEGWRLQVLATINQPDRILAGGEGELLAVRQVQDSKCLVVVYREDANDGFIITAFLTRRLSSLEKRRQLWP